MNKRLDRDFRHLASDVGKSMETLKAIHRIFDTNDLVGINPLELCEELYAYLRDMQRTLSIMMAINNGIYKPKMKSEKQNKEEK